MILPFNCKGRKNLLSEPLGFSGESNTGGRSQSLPQSLGVTEAILKPDLHLGEAVLTGSHSSRVHTPALGQRLK